jgi:hypothetical protein
MSIAVGYASPSRSPRTRASINGSTCTRARAWTVEPTVCGDTALPANASADCRSADARFVDQISCRPSALSHPQA